MNTHRFMQEQTLIAQRIGKIRAFLETSPEGHVCRARRSNANYYFTDITKNRERTRKYLGPEASAQVDEYIKKAYYEKLLPELEWNYKALQYFLKHYDPNPEHTVLEALPEWASEIIRNSTMTDKEKYIQEWARADYKINPVHPENRKICTSRGDYVRSKGERDIANALYRKDLAYRPDCEVQLADGIIYADFVILHPVTLEPYYWEHSGMLGDPSYTQANYDRLGRYARSGILVGERLIVTGENNDNVLGTQAIDRLIEAFFGV